MKKIVIFPDDKPFNPRECGNNLGTIVCYPNRDDIGDDATDRAVLDFQEKWNDKNAVILPLFLMDHSGLTLSTSPDIFRAVDQHGCDWGQIGFIFVSHENIKKEYGKINSETIRMATETLLSEVKEYSTYLEGGVVAVALFNDDTLEDELFGIYADTIEEIIAIARNNFGDFDEVYNMNMARISPFFEDIPKDQLSLY